MSRKYRIDQTPYIDKYEKANQPFVICLRPAGFNKTLFLSMLKSFYEIDPKNQKIRLFKNLYISNFNLSAQSKFYVFYLDFSRINSLNRSKLTIEYSSEISLSITEFQNAYRVPLIQIGQTSPLEMLNKFIESYCQYPLFVLINEFAGFHHSIVNEPFQQASRKPVDQNLETVQLYQFLKTAQTKGKIKRIFIIGIDDAEDR